MILVGDNGQLFGWSESTWLWLDQIGILVGDSLMLVTIFTAIWAWFRWDRIRLWFSTNYFSGVGSEVKKSRWDALVHLVSNSEVPCWLNMQLKPKAISLLATEQSRSVARIIADDAERLGISVLGVQYIDDPDDPADSRRMAAVVIDKLRENDFDRIAIDLTGGRKPMSLGAFMAAEEAGCDSIYVAAQYDNKLRKPSLASARICCIACSSSN
jgi:hypothetical protein